MIALLLLACRPVDDGTLVLDDATNYRYTATMQAERLAVAAWQDATVSWGGLSQDLQARPVDPLALDRLSLVRLRLSPDQVLQAVADSALSQSDVMDYRLLDGLTGRDSARLSEMSILGNPFDPAEDLAPAEEGVTWILSLWDLDREGRDDILSSIILEPAEGAAPTDITFTDQSASFELRPELQDLPTMSTSARAEGWTLSWSTLSRTGSDQDFDPLLADRLVILRFEATLAEVEADFVRLASNEAQAWRAEAYGLDELALAEAMDDQGAAFPGFDREGTWLVGLECTSCTNPVPLALGVVEVLR